MLYDNLKGKAALYCGAHKPFKVKEYTVTPPAQGMALLKLLASGVCGTDVHIMRGRLAIEGPMIIGHEFIGEIVDVNAQSDGLKIGDKVIFNMATPCGKCLLCTTGDSANCLNFEVAYARNPDESPHFFGGYADYAYAKINALIKLPDGVGYLAAAMFPCAGPTIIHALKLGGIFANKANGIKRAVVTGAGPLGLFSALWLSLAGVEDIIVSVRDTAGVRAQAVRELTDARIYSNDELAEMGANGYTADLCIECSGNPQAFQSGCDILRNRGIFLVPGQYSDSGVIPFAPQVITFKALQIFGSSQYDADDVSHYIDFLDANKNILPKIEGYIKSYGVSEINEAMDAAERHLYSKVVLADK